jgi:hypothetical protein
MLKRLSFFLSIFAIIGLVIGIGWFIRFRNSANPTTPVIGTEDTTITPGGIKPGGISGSSSTASSTASTVPVPAVKSFGLVADQEVSAYYAYPDQSVILIQPSGQIIKVAGTEGVVLSSLGISNLNHAAFSYDGKKIVATFGNQFNRQVSVFDIDRKSWEPVFARPDSNPLWSPNDYRLAFLVSEQKKNTASLIDMKASTPKIQEVAALQGSDLTLFWKSSGELFISEKPTAYASAQLFTVDIAKKTVRPLLRDIPGIDLLWNSSVQQGILFQANKDTTGGKMSLISADGVVARQFSFTTLPREKCVFDNTAVTQASTKLSGASGTVSYDTIRDLTPVLICATPKIRARLAASILPDDYLQKDLTTEDSILEINLSTGSITDLSTNITEGIDAINLTATPQSIYFINRYNNKLYRLSRS